MLAGESNGAGFGASALHAPLSTARGQADAAGVGNVGGVGTAAQEMGTSKGPGAGYSGSSFVEVYGQQQYLPAPQHLAAQEGAAGGVVLQQPPPAADGSVEQLDAPMPFIAAGGNEASDEEEEDVSRISRAPHTYLRTTRAKLEGPQLVLFQGGDDPVSMQRVHGKMVLPHGSLLAQVWRRAFPLLRLQPQAQRDM